jgi:hypothetical protein
MDFYIFLIILLSGDIEQNPGPRPPPNKIRFLYSNIRGLMKNVADLKAVSYDYDIIMCAETLASDRRCNAELLLPGFQTPLRIQYKDSRNSRGMALYLRDGFPSHRFTKHECGCHELMVVRVCSTYHNLYIFGVYRSPSGDNSIFDCLLTKMAMIQQSDSKAAFVFVGDFNAHHTEWLNSNVTDSHGRAAMDFENVSGCSQLIEGPTHVSGNCLDLLYTDIPAIMEVGVVAPIGSSDHSSIRASVCLRQRVPRSSFKQKVLLKSRVNWDLVRRDASTITSGQLLSSSDPAETLNKKLSQIITKRVPTKTILYRSDDKVWFNRECRNARTRKQEMYHRWRTDRSEDNWNAYVRARAEAQHVYENAEKADIIRTRETLIGANAPHKWWSTLKSSLFGSSPSVPPLISPGGSLVCGAKDKADLLMTTFDGKQNHQQLNVVDAEPLTDPPYSLSSFAFRSREVEGLIADLDTHGGTDPLGVFPLFLIETRSILSPKISAVFRFLVRSGSFPRSWRIANITPIPKGSSSPDPVNYRPISITPLISRIFERLLKQRLSSYLESNDILPNEQFAFRKGLGTNDALLTIVHKIQAALDDGKEVRLAQIDFRAAFDVIIHSGLLYKLRKIGLRGSFLSLLEQFLTDRRHRVCVNGSFSDWHDVRSGVPQGSVLGPILFIIFTADIFRELENELFCYADDSTLMRIINSPIQRPSACDSLNRDLSRISEWCESWGMKINPEKSKSLLISRSRTALPVYGDLFLQGNIVSDCNVLEVLGVKLDKSLSFEPHIRSLVKYASQRLGILRKSHKLFSDNSVTASCFRCFVLPLLEYCSPVWSSAAQTHLNLVDAVFRTASFLCGDEVTCNLKHRRSVGKLSLLFKIINNKSHPLNSNVPDLKKFSKHTRLAESSHKLSLKSIKCKTNQFQRSFLPSTVALWNSLTYDICNSSDLDTFKSRANNFLRLL